MNEYPTIISFFTRSWKYPKYAGLMIRDCERMGLNHHIVERKDTGDYLANTRMKPVFIYETLQELKTPVLWIDVDGSLMKLPELFKGDYPFDFAARKMAPHRKRIWQVGTLYLNYTDAALSFLQEWNRRISEDTWSDELSLDDMWKSSGKIITNLRVDELPEDYFEMLRVNNPEPSRHAIICHRASKGDSKALYKAKGKIGKG